MSDLDRAAECDCVEEIEQKIKEHGWPKLRPIEALSLRIANRRMAGVEDSISKLATELQELRLLVNKFHETVYDPEQGIIVKQNKALDRAHWTIVVISVIGGIITFLLGTAVGFLHLIGK